MVWFSNGNEDRESRLEVGYGLESILTDSYADDIINNEEVKEAFRDEDYNTGLNKIIDQVSAAINSKPHKWIMN